MRTVAVLQARMSSSRFPGKVLEPLVGQPMILRQIERINRATQIDKLVVATSTDSSDDGLVRVLQDAAVEVVRGDLNDVLARFIQVLDEKFPDESVSMVRLTGDCPLISPSVIDQVVSRFAASSADYLSNTMQPSFPDGLDVEVVSSDVLRAVANASRDAHEHEHVTLGIYRRADQYAIENFKSELNNGHLRWTVDTPDDFAFVKAIYEGLYSSNPRFDYEDILDYLAKHPELNRTNKDSPRNAALIGLDTGAMDATV